MSSLAAIKYAAKTVSVPFELLRAICTIESGLDASRINPNDGLSPSYGLCQIKLATANLVGYRGDSEGLMTPKTNALYAAKYLKKQLKRYSGDWYKATSAYNAGRYKVVNGKYVAKVFNELTSKEILNARYRRKNKKYPNRIRKHVISF